jgi:signal transduction histidine kinase
LRHKNGEYRWIETVGMPRFTPKGDFLGYIAACFDIHDRKIMEFQLEKARLEAEEANQKKSQTLANMSHELRTPLNAIIGFSEMLVNGLGSEDSGKRQQYLQNISKSGHHLLSMVNDILDLAKIEAGRIEILSTWIKITSFIYDLQEIVAESAAQKNVHICFQNECNLNDLYADPVRLRQILLNLLSNAVKFNHEGGKVVITFSCEDDAWYLFKISDTGIGIPKDKIPNLFKEYYQVDNSYARSYEGTGLGLALTKRLVELHGGNISVESEEGVGSVFTFRLPK